MKVYAEVPIFTWFKMFQTSLVFNFFVVVLLTNHLHQLCQKPVLLLAKHHVEEFHQLEEPYGFRRTQRGPEVFNDETGYTFHW